MPSRNDAPTGSTTPAGVREHLAIVVMLAAVLVVLLPLGLLWAIIVWMVGAALLWTSPVWNPSEKALGTLVWPGGLIGPTVLASSATQVCSYVSAGGDATAAVTSAPMCTGFALDPWLGIPLTLLALGAPVVVGVVLLSRTSHRRSSWRRAATP